MVATESNRADESNPTKAEADWPAAVIAGAYQTGVLGMRTLVRRGVRAVCFDLNPRLPGFRSVYGRARLCPNPDTDPARWLGFMRDLSAEVGGKPVLIASADQFVSAIADHAHELADHYTLSSGVPMHGALALKQTQYDLAAKHGMPLPRTQLVQTADEAAAFAETAQFPCLLKPLHFREWQAFPTGHPLSHLKVAIVRTPEDLVRQWTLASAINANVIAQEIIEGPDTDKRVYLSCYDAGGRRIGHAMFRELRCNPVGFGPASVTEPVVDAETDTICDDFLRSIGYVGICEIEMKRDSRDGRMKLIEANPRLSGGGDAAPYAGVDLCWLHYLDLIGRHVTPVAPNGRDFRHVVLRSDMNTIVAYRRARLISWMDVVRSYRPPLAFYDFDRRDWRYSAETIYRMARSGVSALVEPLRARRSST
jgi:D-aspartate ligase